MKKTISILLCGVLALLFSSCRTGGEKTTLSFEAMDTYMSVTINGGYQTTAGDIQSKIGELDSQLSVTNSDGMNVVNDVYLLNKNGTAQVSQNVLELTRQSLDLCSETGGALDITVFPVVEEWGFISKDYKIPSAERLADMLPLVDYRKVSCEDGRITLNQGMKLDFGAVAKGYAADKAVEILKEAGVGSAILNLGGTVAAYGEKENGTPWKIGVADPDNSASYMGYLNCRDKIIATSGSYERSFVGKDGKTYSHIIDPKTGVPVDNGIASVTIISGSGVRSDGLSTALFVLGIEKAEEYHRAHPDFDYIIITGDKKAYVSSGAAETFKIADGYNYEIITVI